MKEADFTRACLLLLIDREPGYAYDIRRRFAEVGVAPRPEAMYRLLRRMEEDGLVRSKVGPSTKGPNRRNYVVTKAGRERLQTLAAEIEKARDGLDAFLRFFENG